MGFGPATLSFTVLDPVKIPTAERPRWAVLGRSNVGKSTFLNALLHPHKFFRTGRTPGVTLGLIGVRVQLGKHPKAQLELVDMPGFGYAQALPQLTEQWSRLAEVLKSRSPHIQWLWLVDPVREPGDEEKQLKTWLGEQAYLFVFTKSDKISLKKRSEVENIWRAYHQGSTEKIFWVSSLKGEGFQELEKSAKAFVRSASEIGF